MRLHSDIDEGGTSTAMRRVASYVRRHGVRGLLQAAGQALRDRVQLREEHVWYELVLESDRPARDLADGVVLTLAGGDDLHRLEELDRGESSARKNLAAGNDLWLAYDADHTLFGCWIYRRLAPVLAAPGGWLELPDGVVCLEDSITTPPARGRGIAPASWSRIADSLQAEGVGSMVTKVEVANQPSRKAVLKAGFREIGMMELRRTGTRKRVEFATEDSDTGNQLADRLATP